ncbi:MAG TPA: peptidase inhibitor family I36 protein, partial [Devosia sp.]|nr:peptidase inhibitor family I36 protein [Devosia sp.]
FYDRTRFRGESFCLESGDSVRNLADWADRISSVDNPDGLAVQVCSESSYRNCRTYTTSASSLGDFDDYIVSIRVR